MRKEQMKANESPIQINFGYHNTFKQKPWQLLVNKRLDAYFCLTFKIQVMRV